MSKKWNDKIKPNFVPQVIQYRTKDNKNMKIILDKNTNCFKEWVAEIIIGKESVYVDRDELVMLLSRQTIKKGNAIYG